jgi:protocatechuate 3,4-dioxygenase beta subunit
MTMTRSYEGRPLPHPADEVVDQGLAFDIETILDRRGMLKLIGLSGVSVGLFALGGCAPPLTSATTQGSSAPSATSSVGSSSAVQDEVLIPEETAGPFPGDGSNGPDVLTQSGVVRQDIRSSFGSGSATAAGVPLTIQFSILDAGNGFAPLAGTAVYVWHCDQAGRYSLYSDGVTSENYLRGVQAADGNGLVTFTSIFPACYSGRWPHIHFEVYPSLDQATTPSNAIATSQIALPEDTCRAVYATSGYEQSVANLSQVSLASDMVFGDDGGVHELGTIRGSVASGLVVALQVGVQTA